MISLNPKAGYVVGLKLMEDRAVCAVTDLEATVLNYVEQPVNSDHSFQAVAAALGRIINSALTEAQVPRERVRGVGIGLAGVIDTQTGVVHYSPFFHWKDAPLAQALARQLGLPVYLENDVNTLTITEQLFGAGHTRGDFAVMTVGRGIGLGMVLNHQIYRGTHGGVGELGHLTLVPDGPPCDCGKQGCLEALAADPAVLRDVQQALAAGRSSILNPESTIADVIDAANQGDALARESLERSGYYLGLGLSVVINILSPSLIIISGEGVVAGDYRLRPMFEAMRAHTFNGLLDHVQTLVKPTDDQAWARGAAGLVVGKLFESPLIEDSHKA
jgi:predicted NBD/HSP70 family sugar kinase